MRHIQLEEWVMYVQDELDETTRIRYEQHLATCDLCLTRYIEALENNVEIFPQLSPDFTDDVVKYVREQTKPKQQKAQKNKSFFHYVIAAAMTLLLMVSGIFGELAQLAGSIEQRAENPSSSLTDELMNKTLSFLEEFERNKEAK